MYSGRKKKNQKQKQKNKKKKNVKKVSDIDDNCLAWFGDLVFRPYLTSIHADTHDQVYLL